MMGEGGGPGGPRGGGRGGGPGGRGGRAFATFLTHPSAGVGTSCRNPEFGYSLIPCSYRGLCSVCIFSYEADTGIM
jgi:hypothetical protein